MEEEYRALPSMFDRLFTNTSDPIHAMMLKRRQQQENPTEFPSITEYSDTDIKALEEFCREHGILGFNCGRMNPKAALMMLKGKMGIVETPKSTKQLLKD